MKLSDRTAQEIDFPACISFIEDFGYYSAEELESLKEMWIYLFSNGMARSVVVEDRSQQVNRIVGFGMTVCVERNFVKAIHEGKLLRGPGQARQCLGQYMLSTYKTKNSPIFRAAAIDRAANRGIHLLGLHCGVLPGLSAEERGQVLPIMRDTVKAYHCDLKLDSFVKEVYTKSDFDRHLKFGFTDWDRNSHTTTSDAVLPCSYIVGVTREIALQPGNEERAVRRLFEGYIPTILLTRRLHDVLRAALEGKSDEEISQEIKITTDGIRKRWRAIFASVQKQHPELLPRQHEPGKRGKGKRRILLSKLQAGGYALRVRHERA